MEISSANISAVIPSLRGDTTPLEQALRSQTIPPGEIEVVRGVRPNGRARNVGVARTSGGILLFIDDDALPLDEHLVEKLVQTLLADDTIGVAGAARILPAGAPWFQRRVAWEIPRTTNPIPDTLLETNPPLDRYGHSLITTTCCAMRRELYDQVNGFSEALPSGVDTDFFYRVRKLGYRFVMAPGVAVTHPAPENLRALWKKFFWYGQGYGQEAQHRPQQHLGINLHTPLRRWSFLAAAALWMVPNIFILYSLGYPHFELGFRPLKAFSTFAVACGYFRAWKAGAR